MRELARYPLTNTSGLAIYRVDEDVVLVGLNDEVPVELPIAYDDDGRAWFEWGGHIYLDECLKILG